MRPLSSLRLSFKLPLVLCLVVASVASAIGAIMIYRERGQLGSELRESALLLARSVAVVASEPLLRGDSWTLYKALRQITQGSDGSREPTLMTAMVLDSQGRVMAHIYPAMFPIGLPAAIEGTSEYSHLMAILALTQPTTSTGAGFIEGVVPIRGGERTIGLVLLRLSTAELERRLTEAVETVLVLAVSIALIASILGSIWSIRTLKPLQTLSQSMDALSEGRFHPLLVSRNDEIGQLVASFNNMAAELDDKRRLTNEMAANEKVIALGRIAAGVAHEVNNPLAGMLNCLSTLRATSNDPQLVARYLPLIEKGLQKIEALVKDLLIELRVEGAHEIGDALCLEDVRELIAAEIDANRIEFTWDNRLEPTDQVNRSKMQQILLNLLRNAIQAMPQGGALRCRFSSEPHALIFVVDDTGEGIQAADLKRIFDPFFTSRPNGTGLGLWIVLRLVQSMRGRIDVDSVPGRGTSFRIQIPREAALATQ